MATKPKTQKAPAAAKAATAEDLARKASDKADEDKQTARVMTNGQCNAIVVQQYLQFINGGGDIQALSRVSGEQARAIGNGDFSSLEAMLLTQAMALQAMFVDLALRAKRQDRFEGIQTMTTLALKCAAQSRQAVTALAELRMPKTVMFAKQANVSSGPQQVNNSVVAQPSPARAEEIQNRPNELLECTMATHWTPERRARQAALIRTWRPWNKSTGPKTPAGKAVSANNAFKGGHCAELRALKKAVNAMLREQRGLV